MIKQWARRGLMIGAGLFFTMAMIAGAADKIELSSPDGNLKAGFYNQAGKLGYDLSFNGKTVIETSPLGIIVDGVDLGQGSELPASVSIRTVKETIPVRGNHTIGQNYYNTAMLSLKTGAVSWQLEARVFNDGFGFRYLMPGKGSLTINGEATGFKIPAQSLVYFQTNTVNNEGIHQKRAIEQVNATAGMPVTVKLPDAAGYLALTEAAVYHYSGMSLKTANDRLERGVFLDDQSWPLEAKPDAPAQSPWRVVMVAKDLNGLVNCDLSYDLSPDPEPRLFADADSWIKPGRALWSWWSEGTGGLARQKRYADEAQKLGFEYILVDEGWERWSPKEDEYWAMVKDLTDYARTKGVGVWLWKHWGKLKDEKYRDEFFSKVKASGAVGVKIDFMDNESKAMIDFYEAALQDAAKYKLMVNFHGANKPTGESRTYPNEMTREGIRGLEYNRGIIAPNPASYNATLPFTRFLAGHADYTPVTFNFWKMGNTSYSHQLATAIVFLSEVTHYADKPENFLDNPKTAPALEVLKALPTVWDETVVLPGSEIGEVAAFARRSGDRWFLAVLNGGGAKNLSLNLSFLAPGKYRATVLTDQMSVKNGFNRADKTVGPADKLEAKMRKAGGFVAMITPAH